jgi:hypothetical protein
MLTFFGDLIAKKEARTNGPDGAHEYHVTLFRTEAPGYVLAVHYRNHAASHYWAAHTPKRLKVADLFDQYLRDRDPQGAAMDLLKEAMQEVMLQAPELDEMVQWSSVVAKD